MSASLTPVASSTPVIILNWNGWSHTVECLRSLQHAPDVGAVWVVDNGSSVDCSEEAQAAWPGLRVIRLERNYGFAGGMNRAMRIAVAEGHAFVYLLNNDTTVVPGFLSAALDAASAPEVALVGSRIAGYGSSSGLVFFDGDYHIPHQLAVEDSQRSRIVSHVNGAGMLVRLSALERHGYFDERFFCYHEEVDLGWRLARAGWSLLLATGSCVFHRREGSDDNSNALYYRVRNRFLLCENTAAHGGSERRLTALRHAAALGRRAIRLKQGRDWRAIAAAVSDGLGRRYGERQPCRNPSVANLQLLLLCAFVPGVGWLRAPAKPRRLRTAGP